MAINVLIAMPRLCVDDSRAKSYDLTSKIEAFFERTYSTYLDWVSPSSSSSFNTLPRTYKGRGRWACKGGDAGRAMGTPRSVKALAKSRNHQKVEECCDMSFEGLSQELML